jgi:hypothetical protein
LSAILGSLVCLAMGLYLGAAVAFITYLLIPVKLGTFALAFSVFMLSGVTGAAFGYLYWAWDHMGRARDIMRLNRVRKACQASVRLL